MRFIDTIVVHHSGTPRICDFKRAINAFNNAHRKKLHPKKNGLGYNIAYHYVIANNGEILPTRPKNEIGYHCGNWEINKKSIGIMLIGDFRTDKPSKEQLISLQRLVTELKNKLNIQTCIGHREVKPTACPGKNISNEFIHNLLYNKKTMDEFKTYKEWLVAHAKCNDKSWTNSVTKQELAKMLYNANKPFSIKDSIMSHISSLVVNIVFAAASAFGLAQFMPVEMAIMAALTITVGLQSGSTHTVESAVNKVLTVIGVKKNIV